MADGGPSYDPLVVGYRRLSGGDWQVTWSIAPALVVRRTIPVEEFNPATVAILGREIAEKYKRKEPNG